MKMIINGKCEFAETMMKLAYTLASESEPATVLCECVADYQTNEVEILVVLKADCEPPQAGIWHDINPEQHLINKEEIEAAFVSSIMLLLCIFPMIQLIRFLDEFGED